MLIIIRQELVVIKHLLGNLSLQDSQYATQKLQLELDQVNSVATTSTISHNFFNKTVFVALEGKLFHGRRLDSLFSCSEYSLSLCNRFLHPVPVFLTFILQIDGLVR